MRGDPEHFFSMMVLEMLPVHQKAYHRGCLDLHLVLVRISDLFNAMLHFQILQETILKHGIFFKIKKMIPNDIGKIA